MTVAAVAGLTPRMRDCLSAIQTYIAANQCSPSYDDLRRALKLSSKSPILRLLESLQARGWITYQRQKPRSIRIEYELTGVKAYILPPAVDLKLRAFCTQTGEDPAAIVADAVALMIDAAEHDRSRGDQLA